ncbi:hypothetical protein Salat_0684000 [Sesamum alatum]|uniref:Uncharacterized protein n=1 Tax=Sesamum alatum TaxID=300844 RepID=A0AAE1YS72_9LAMI|nr:hypothetical protein Salat_0684000 [Sesamum alatum]
MSFSPLGPDQIGGWLLSCVGEHSSNFFSPERQLVSEVGGPPVLGNFQIPIVTGRSYVSRCRRVKQRLRRRPSASPEKLGFTHTDGVSVCRHLDRCVAARGSTEVGGFLGEGSPENGKNGGGGAWQPKTGQGSMVGEEMWKRWRRRQPLLETMAKGRDPML